MSDPEPPADEHSDSTHGDIVDAVYEVALDPSRYGELVDRWHREITLAANRAPNDPANDPLADHFERATTILERVHKDDWQMETRASPLMPELVLSAKGRVLKANPGAIALLSAQVGAPLQALDLTANAQTLLADVVAQLGDQTQSPAAVPASTSAQSSTARVLRLNRAGDERPLVVLLTPSQNDTSTGVILRCAEIVWPDSLGPLLARAFDLTGAETQIVQALVAGGNSATIASTRGTSRETVRTQIRELLAKTSTHSQLELIRMTIGFSMMAQQAEARSGSNSQGPPSTSGTVNFSSAQWLPQQSLIKVGPDRFMEVLQYGNTSVPPTLAFHDEVIGDGFLLPLLKHNPDLHFVVPVRHGYGQTDLIENSDMPARVRQTTIDLAKVVDTANATRDASAMPILAHGNGTFFACHFAAAQPNRCSSITALSPSLPRTSDETSDATRYATFLSSMASLAPSMLRFAVQAGFAMYARTGAKRFLQTVYGSVPADLAVIDNPEHLSDLEHGGRLTLAQGYRGFLHDEQAMAQDWTEMITSLSLPVHLIMGDAESTSRRERAERLGHLTERLGTVQTVAARNARFLLAFSEPELVLATMKDAHDDSTRAAERA